MKKIHITASAPLKLMIAGEWSVLIPGNHGVVTALDSRVSVEVTESINQAWFITTSDGRTFSERLPPDQWNIADPYWKFAFTVLRMAMKWYSLSTPLTIKIITPTAARYGLGSSAAVCVALAAAVITAASHIIPSREEILRLALLAHIQAQSWRGSGCDCAAATYGGTIRFRSFDVNYLQHATVDRHSWELILHDIRSSVCSLPEQPFQDMLPFWTGHKESTVRLIENSEALFGRESWLACAAEGQTIALAMADAVSGDEAKRCLSLAGNWFFALNFLTQGRIVTERMQNLIDHLARLEITAKPSGAGGGDCLVGIVPQARNVPHIRNLALSLAPNAEGVSTAVFGEALMTRAGNVLESRVN